MQIKTENKCDCSRTSVEPLDEYWSHSGTRELCVHKNLKLEFISLKYTNMCDLNNDKYSINESSPFI